MFVFLPFPSYTTEAEVPINLKFLQSVRDRAHADSKPAQFSVEVAGKSAPSPCQRSYRKRLEGRLDTVSCTCRKPGPLSQQASEKLSPGAGKNRYDSFRSPASAAAEIYYGLAK